MQRLIETACVFVMGLAVTATVYAAGSSLTFAPNNLGVGSNTFYLEITWVSDDSTGAVAGTTTSAINEWLAGKIIIGADTIPSSTAAPDDNYDIEILELAQSTDTTGIDIMGPSTHPLHDRDTSTWEAVVPEATTATAGTAQNIVAFKDKYYRVSVTHAGNSKAGKLGLTLRR